MFAKGYKRVLQQRSQSHFSWDLKKQKSCTRSWKEGQLKAPLPREKTSPLEKSLFFFFFFLSYSCLYYLEYIGGAVSLVSTELGTCICLKFKIVKHQFRQQGEFQATSCWRNVPQTTLIHIILLPSHQQNQNYLDTKISCAYYKR